MRATTYGPLPSSSAPRSLLARAWLGCVCALAFASPAVAAVPHDVLVLYPYGRRLETNPESIQRSNEGYGFGGLTAGFAARPDVPVSISSEFLDKARFGGPEHEQAFVAYLREKYESQPPDVIVAVSDVTLDMLLRHRAELFPRIPIVHIGVGADTLRSMGALPADVVGTPVAYDVVGTIEQARRWHPNARHLVLVTGTSPWDREWEARLRTEVRRLPPGLDTVFLAGLSTDETRRRLLEVPADSIVFTPGFFRDADGRRFEPRESVRLVVGAAPAPVYVPYATFVGTGAVGGRVANYETMGEIGAATVLAILDGSTPAQLRPPAALPMPLEVDWRQLKRWRIPESAMPDHAIVKFREQTLWEAYRVQALAVGAVMLLQGGLILALLFERRRRRRTEARMRLAASAAGLSTWIYDGNGGDAKGRVRAREGTDVADFHDTLARIAPQDRPGVLAALDEARESHGEFAAEYRVEGPDGEWRWQAARGRADRAQPRRLLGVALDVTQRKRAELQAEQDRAALYHMTRVSLLGQLSASIAHQLNQPLASILGNAEAALKMLDRAPPDVPELREICRDIVSADNSAAQAIRRLGALFKRGEPLFEALDLNELVRDTIQLTRSMLNMRHVTLSTDLEPALPPVSGDRVQLQQLLLNLIVNACDAMAGVPDERREATVRTESSDGTIKLCVIDRGPGVPPEAIGKVFEPFWSTRPGGMGMGLAVSHTIAEAHRGSLTLRNAPEGGAVFCLRLPAMVTQ